MSEERVLRLSVLDLRQEMEAVSKLASGFLSAEGQRAGAVKARAGHCGRAAT